MLSDNSYISDRTDTMRGKEKDIYFLKNNKRKTKMYNNATSHRVVLLHFGPPTVNHTVSHDWPKCASVTGRDRDQKEEERTVTVTQTGLLVE